MEPRQVRFVLADAMKNFVATHICLHWESTANPRRGSQQAGPTASALLELVGYCLPTGGLAELVECAVAEVERSVPKNSRWL